MVFAAAAVERAMKVQEVIMRALSGALSWLQAADILGIDPRSLRRWRARYEAHGVLGLYDGRRGQPSRRKAPVGEVQRILRLYQDGYRGWNVRHFYRFARREHGVTLSYSFVRLALQEAGLVRKGHARGRHRRRREPRPCFGELLQLDGSTHAWLRRCPEQKQTLIAVGDDATKRLLSAQLWPSETTHAVMSALSPTTTTSSPGPRPTPPARSCRSTASTSTASSARKKSAPSARTTSSSSSRSPCSWPNNPVAAVAPGCA